MANRQVFYNGDLSNPYTLKEGNDLFIIRFKSKQNPNLFLKGIKGLEELMPRISLRSRFVDSNAYVFQHDQNDDFRDEVKRLVRNSNSEELDFIGSIFKYDHSGVFQIYTGNIYLEMDPAMSPNQVLRFFNENNLLNKRPLNFGKNIYFCEFKGKQTREIFAFAKELLSKPEVKCCHPELVTDLTRDFSHGIYSVNDTDLSNDWWSNKIDLEAAWELTKGEGATIAILDDGLDKFHSAFRGKIVAPLDMMDKSGKRFPAHQDGQNHGTPCASIAVSRDSQALGVAPMANLMPIRIGGLGSVLQSEAICQAVKNGADIISCSWGPPDGDISDPNDNENYFPLPDHTKKAFQYAVEQGRNGKGVPIVFAAGNGKEPVKFDGYASANEVIAVAASNYRDEPTVYSDFGYPVDCTFPSGDYDLNDDNKPINKSGIMVADRQGGDGYSQTDYYSIFSGTSASCPGVAGILALMISANPSITFDSIKSSFPHICKRIGKQSDYDSKGYSEQFGYGLINAKKAVDYASGLRNITSPKKLTMDNTKKNAVSLHIGINKVDDTYYQGNVSPLNGCVNDMKNMQNLAEQIGYNTHSLKNSKATKENIYKGIVSAGNSVKEGGILWITYAGHGARIEDDNNARDDYEDDFKDESWVTYNGFLLDDEIYNALAEIESEIRVVLLSDSCHSETMTRNFNLGGYKERKVDPQTVRKILKLNDQTITGLRQKINRSGFNKVSVINLSACLQKETAKEIEGEGVFSKIIKEVYLESKDAKSYNYKTFIEEVNDRVGDIVAQEPNYSLSHIKNTEFLNQFPFSINQEINSPTHDDSINDKGVGNADEDLVVATETGELLLYAEGFKKVKRIVNKERSATNAGWDHAYQHLVENYYKGIKFVEPNIIANVYHDSAKAELRSSDNSYLNTYPPFLNEGEDVEFDWHLGDDFTGLKTANRIVFSERYKGGSGLSATSKTVRIAHIDTGILEDHPTRPLNIISPKRITLTKEEKDALDKNKTLYPSERQGHGQATIALLAGGWLDYSDTDHRFQGYFGAIPFAEVVPIKISETVVLITGRNFAKAVDHAIETKCDVITMSMAGLPSRVMAEAVDKAYEAGIVIVSAAGNCWSKGVGRAAPKKSMYPARYDRVVAAVGATYEKVPYLNEYNKNDRDAGGLFMQSCYGPRRALATSVAAFTPNITWFDRNDNAEKRYYRKSGGGTSSATPQIAAAAALYIQKHREALSEITKGWKRAEIVRQAIFRSADNSSGYTKDYFGNGILNAKELLDDRFSPGELKSTIKKQEKAKIQRGHGRLGLLHLYTNRNIGECKPAPISIKDQKDIKRIMDSMMMSEIQQLLYIDPSLHSFQNLDLDDSKFDIEQYPDLTRALVRSKHSSFGLKESLKVLHKEGGFRQLDSTMDGTEVLIESELGHTKVRGEGLKISVFNTRSYFEGEGAGEFVIDEFEVKLQNSERKIRGNASLNIETSGDDPESNAEDLIHSEVLIESVYEDKTLLRLNWDEGFEQLKTRSMSSETLNSKSNSYTIPYELVKKRGLGKKLLKLVVKVIKWVRPKLEDVIPEDVGSRKEMLQNYADKLGDAKYEILVLDIKSKFKRSKKSWRELSKDEIEHIKKTKKEILICLPGLMSKVEGGFDEFFDNPQTVSTLKGKYCRYVIGINVPTVLNGIEKNAKVIDQMFKDLGFNRKECSVLAKSRGGIVARHLFEVNWFDAISQKSKKDAPFILKRLLMTGTPNQGTRMASSENWKSLFNTIINYSKTPLGKFIPVLPGIVTALKALSLGFIELPGIDDLEEGSDMISLLNEIEAPRDNYWVVTSNFEPSFFLTKLFDEKIIDSAIFSKQANDLITPCEGAIFSNPNFPTDITLDPAKILWLEGQVGHFGYLKSKNGVAAEILKLLSGQSLLD